MKTFPEPGPANSFLDHHIRIVRESLRHWTGQDLIETNGGQRDAAERVYHAPFVLLSHDAGPDPVFNYANLAGQELFGMSWFEMTSMPSRRSAEPVNQEHRKRVLQEVAKRGFIDQYESVRIAKNGRRFLIFNAIIWNLIGADGNICGQAAKFDQWKYLDEANT
jgi:MEKHLA domain